MKKITSSMILERLRRLDFHPDQVTKRGDEFIGRWGFFYPHGNSADKIAARMKEVMPDIEITHTEDVWTPFNGFAPVSRQSHFQVRFKLTDHVSATHVSL